MEAQDISRYFKEASLASQICLFDQFREQGDAKPIMNYLAYGWLPGRKCDLPFMQKIEFYDALRQRSYRLAEKVMASSSINDLGEQVRLTGFNVTAQAAWKYQWKPQLKGKALEQRLIDSDFIDFRCVTYGKNRGGRRARYCNEAGYRPGRFEAAIWQGDTLCGLTYGGKNEDFKENIVAVHLLEGHPASVHPLKGKIFKITLIAAAAYAHVLGHDLVRINSPFSKGTLKQAGKHNLILKEELWGRLFWGKQRNGWISHPDIYVPVRRVIENGQYILNQTTAAPA